MRPSIGAIVLALLLGCKEKKPSPPRENPSAPKGEEAQLFDSGFEFDCSPQPEIGCQGVFPPREEGSEVFVIESGEDAFRYRIQTLRAAKQSIRIQALIFRGDDSGLFIADLLKQKKAEGVDVRVIVDAVSNLDWKTQWMYFDLKQHGIEVEGYEALYLQFVTAEKPENPLHANKRFHDKMWVVDGGEAHGVAIVGGLNIANEYFRVDQTPENLWQDQDVAVRGPLMRDVRDAFDRNYDFFKDIKARRPKLMNPDNVWKLARKTVGRIMMVKIPDWTDPKIQERIGAVLAKPVEPRFLPIEGRFLQSRPRMKETYIGQAYAHLIDSAKARIQIANAYFVPSKDLIARLHGAARRGVRVEIVTNSPDTNDIRQVAVVSRHLYKPLLAVNREQGVAPITLREWSKDLHGEGTLHAKFAVFDGEAVIVGSYNLDPRSALLNSETALAISDPNVSGRLGALFEGRYRALSEAVEWSEAVEYHRPAELEAAFELLFALPLRRWL